jgi:hypothetical protein
MFSINSDDPLPKMTAPGSLHLNWTTCGKPTCRCAKGILHGPYVYRRWREGGRQRKLYTLGQISPAFWPRWRGTEPWCPGRAR